jgi:aspartate/methionine/tyrosine aminotransferase
LRIGWLVGPPDVVDEAWARHEYTTIGITMLSSKLAALGLSPQVRPRLIQRTRDYIQRGFPILEEWLDSHEGVFDLAPPQAAAIAFAHYHLNINSSELAKRLIHDKSVLIAPGDHFGLDHYLRISDGLAPDYLRAGLSRIHALLVELQG